MALPWDFHPDLTRERLVAVANLIANGRDAAVRRHDPTIGDDEWVLGCRAFQACRHNILSEASSGRAPWLHVMDASRHFMFRIGSIPLRFYRGDPEDPNHRTKGQSFPELNQLSLVFPGEDMRSLVCRVAVETDYDGRALGIHCVGTRGEDVVFNWRIPFDVTSATVAVLKVPADGVALAPPKVTELDDDVADNNNEHSGEEEGEVAG